jgi:hypothetical protein
LMLVSARKTGAATAHEVKTLIRQMGYGGQNSYSSSLARSSTDEDIHLIATQEREIMISLTRLQTLMEETQRRMVEESDHIDKLAQVTSKTVMQMVDSVKDVMAQQVKNEDVLNRHMLALREVFSADRETMLSVFEATRRDGADTISAIDACRASFEQSSRSLRSLVSYLDPLPQVTENKQ